MRVTMDMNFSKFATQCEAAISKVAQSTKKATTAACIEIMEESLKQVPRDTNALAESVYYNVFRAPDYGFEGIVGYGQFGYNPKTGRPTGDYAVAVHEDLSAFHWIGKAKYLEDPVRQFAREKFPRTVIKYAKPALDGVIDE